MTQHASTASRLLEELQAAAAAEQARVTAEFASSQRAAQRAAGAPNDRVGRGIAAQVALAKRTSPHAAQRYVGWSTILTTELPHTFATLRSGRTTAWRAMLVARETVWLSRENRATVDRALAPRLEHLGDRAVETAARSLAYRLDPEGYVERTKAAERDRRVTLRPAPETMARLTGTLPVAQGVATYAALSREADSLISCGDGRSRGQIMADTLVERVTGQAVATDVPVEIGLVLTDRTLFEGGSEPAVLDGYGAIPAGIARELVSRPSDATAVWLRRLLHRTGPRRPHGNGVQAALLRAGAAPLRPLPRSLLPHALVRGADPAHRSRDAGRTRRADRRRQRPGLLRGV